ncbi:MAG: septal ring lytic transglycosylase RlpA family protein [Bacteroidales bacterium]|nr:septal ring lytic transglycosylase RlpA family protein [Bacteroidales bacterium]
MKKIRLLPIILCLCNTFCVSAQIDKSKAHRSIATYYHDRFENRLTANGEIFCQNKYTAAHLTYKFGTLLLVTDIATKKWVIVRVNDRCPKRNILDLSKIAAKQIGINIKGVTRVEIQPLPEEYYVYWELQEAFFESEKKNERGTFYDLVDMANNYQYASKESVSKPKNNKAKMTEEDDESIAKLILSESKSDAEIIFD